MSIRNQHIVNHFNEAMAPLVGGTVTSVRGQRFTVAAVDGKNYNVALQSDSEGNDPAKLSGCIPRFAKSPYGSLAALKDLVISRAMGDVDQDDPAAVFPVIEFRVPDGDEPVEEGLPYSVEAGHASWGTGGWIYVWEKGTRIPDCVYQR